MRSICAIIVIIIVAFATGCDNSDGPFTPELINILAGSWSGVLDYSISGGVTTPMTLTFSDEGGGWLSAIMMTGSSNYLDSLVARVSDRIVLNFDVAGEAWELVLEGMLVDSNTFEGDIIRREVGQNDIPLGTFTASPS